ncbi:MAG: hypothetical protein KIT09_23580 [Bryobacteraceae bacterium]|nr:hypothetical protein [Bryobacteraceae bacterium]
MELLRKDQLRFLLEDGSGTCVSIFVPTYRGGADIKQSPIRLKNLLRDAEKELAGRGLRTPQIADFLEPVQKLCDNAGFWRYQSDGLALFRSQNKFLYYRLPLHFDELLVVADRFHVKPVMRLFTEDSRFYVLSLSKHDVRLLQCTRYGVREVDLPPEVPRSMEQVVQTAGIERQTQIHTSGTASKYNRHGTQEEDDKEEVREFFRQVDKGLREILRDERAPLVLAGVEYLFPLYRAANTHAYLIDGGVTGNPEGRRAEELQSDAWPMVEPFLKKTREDTARRYHEFAGSARSSSDLRVVLPASAQGRVEALFVAAGKQVWGSFDRESLAVSMREQRQPGDEDLLDLAAIQTFLQGGDVYAVDSHEVPGGQLLAAVFRY